MDNTKHFVTFYSPGSFFSEYTTKEISGWSVIEAKKMAPSSAFGFQFSTRKLVDGGWKQETVETSGMHYIGGRIFTYFDVEKMTGDYKILLSNMRSNNWTHVIKTKAGNFQPYKYDIDQIV